MTNGDPLLLNVDNHGSTDGLGTVHHHHHQPSQSTLGEEHYLRLARTPAKGLGLLLPFRNSLESQLRLHLSTDLGFYMSVVFFQLAGFVIYHIPITAM